MWKLAAAACWWQHGVNAKLAFAFFFLFVTLWIRVLFFNVFPLHFWLWPARGSPTPLRKMWLWEATLTCKSKEHTPSRLLSFTTWTTSIPTCCYIFLLPPPLTTPADSRTARNSIAIWLLADFFSSGIPQNLCRLWLFLFWYAVVFCSMFPPLFISCACCVCLCAQRPFLFSPFFLIWRVWQFFVFHLLVCFSYVCASMFLFLHFAGHFWLACILFLKLSVFSPLFVPSLFSVCLFICFPFPCLQLRGLRISTIGSCGLRAFFYPMFPASFHRMFLFTPFTFL